jgi:hypothetical protein
MHFHAQTGTHVGYDVVTEFQAKDGWAPGFKVHMERVAGD